MRPARCIAVVATLLAACGGNENGAVVGDAGVSDATRNDAPANAVDGSPSTDARSPSTDAAPMDATQSIDARSEGGTGCTPMPGCTSTTTCPAADGCNTCTCEPGGSWECTGHACDSGASPACAPTVQPGAVCTEKGLVCSYPLPPGGACTTWECNCWQGTWECQETDCDAGSPVDYTCPSSQPEIGSSCLLSGAACSYGPCMSFGGPGISCLCSGGTWQCAALPGCDAGP